MPPVGESLFLDTLKQRFGSSKRRAVEGADLARIRRAASSSPRFDLAFEELAQAIRIVIPFDRISLRFADLEQGNFVEAYFAGTEIPGHDVGDVVSLEGTVTEAAVRRREAISVGDELPEVLLAEYPGMRTAMEAGIRSVVMVPMTRRGNLVPALMFASREPGIYDNTYVQLASSVATEIADLLALSIANAESRLSLQSELEKRERDVSNLEESVAESRRELERLRDELAESERDTGPPEAEGLAEIGRIATSSVEFEEVYESLAHAIGVLVPFDRIEVARIDAAAGTATVTYVGGGATPGLLPVGSFLISGTQRQKLVESRDAMIGGPELSAAVDTEDGDFPSAMAVPLLSNGEVAGVFALRSIDNVYTDDDLALGVRIAAQISGAFALSQAHARLNRELEEQAVVTEVSLLMGESSNIRDSFQTFVEPVRRLIDVDSAAVAILDISGDSATVEQSSGEPIAGLEAASVVQIDSGAKATLSDQGGIVASADEPEQVQAQFPDWAFISLGTVRSLVAAPILVDGDLIAVLFLCSSRPSAYADVDLALARRLGSQMAGAVTGTRQQAQSLQQIQAVTSESATFAEVGRIVARAESADEAYRRVTEQLVGFMPVDRIGYATVDSVDPTLTYRYVAGTQEAGFRVGVPRPLEGTTMSEVVTSGRSFILQGQPAEFVISRFPALVTGVNSGLQSFLEMPVFVGGQVIGSIGLASSTPSAYKNDDILTVERVGAYVTGLMETARIQDAHELDTREQYVFAEMGRTLNSTLDVRLVYDRIAEYLRRLMPYDRVAIWTVDLQGQNLIAAYSAGDDVGSSADGGTFPLGSPSEHSDEDREVEQPLPGRLPERLTAFLRSAGDGLPSLLVIPLVFAGETVGMLSLRSARPNAYTRRDAAQAERFGAQIAGAISNSQLYVETKQVEEAVREVIQRLDLAIQGSGDGLWDWKIASGEVWWSPRFKELIGHRNGEEGGLATWEARLHPEDRARVLKSLKDHIEGKGPYQVEYRLKADFGGYRWFSDRGQAIWDDSGAAVRMAGSLRPVTDATAVGAAPAGAHDLISPLIAMEVFKAALLKDRSDDANGYLDAVMSSGRPLRRLLEGLESLTWAMDTELTPEDVDFSALARSITSDLRKSRGARTVSVSRGLRAEADSDMLSVLLEKLLENAWTFTADRKRARISVGSEDRDGDPVYFVKDNGVGFGEGEAGKLFGAFQRLHSPAEFEGTGLGLATARQIVERHGGTIWAEGQRGKGATFYFTLGAAKS